MNGVMMPSVSAGSSQRDASVMCTPQVMVPSGAAATGHVLRRSVTTASTTTIRAADLPIGVLQAAAVSIPPACRGYRRPGLPREPPENAAITLVGVGRELPELARASAIGRRRDIAVFRPCSLLAHDTLFVRTVAFDMRPCKRGAQPLTEPAVSPWTIYFWNTRTRITAGSAPRKPDAAMTE